MIERHVFDERSFVVVLRGNSNAILEPDGSLLVTGFPTRLGNVNITFRSRWIQHAGTVKYPGHLWIEISGPGSSLEDTIPIFANAALAILPIISVATNAAIGEPQIELGFDSTSGAEKREYFQQYVTPESGDLRYVRIVDCSLVAILIDAISRHRDSERIRRAINQYRIALDSWILGRETMSLAHLWMAVEALTKAAIREELTRRKLNKEVELAAALNVQIEELDATIRRDVILDKDIECYKKAKKASDGFEHGFLGFDRIRQLSTEVRHRMANHVRAAIISMLGVPDEQHKKLLSSPYDKPLGNWPIVRYLRGTLNTTQDDLAAPNSMYPFIRWSPKLLNYEIIANGEVNIRFEESYTPELAEGVTFQPKSVEVWRPS